MKSHALTWAVVHSRRVAKTLVKQPIRSLKRLRSTNRLRRRINRYVLSRFNLKLTDLKRKEEFSWRDRFDFEDEARKYFPVIAEHTFLTPDALTCMYQFVKHVEENNIHGDFVECGVWKGGTMGLIALSQLELGTSRRTFHLFDSFEGLPKAVHQDNQHSKEWLGVQTGENTEKSEGISTLSVDISVSRELLFTKIGYPEEYVNFHQGWFQDTVPTARVKRLIREISILRLDGDLYESTKVCLENFWDLVVPQGFVVIDDYDNPRFEGCKQAVEEFLSTLEFKPFLIQLPRGGGKYIIKS